MFRFHVAIGEMISGNLSPHLTLREGDQLVETSNMLKQLSGSLTSDMTAIGKAVKEIDEMTLASKDAALIGRIADLKRLIGKYKI